MHPYHLIMCISLILFALPFFVALSRYKHLDKASRIFCMFLGLSFAGECTAMACAYVYKNNMPVYAVLNILEMCMLSLYFNYSISSFARWHIGIFISVLSVVLGVVNLVCFQSLNDLNNIYLYYQGIAVIGMSMIAMVQFLINVDYMQFEQTPHFWIPALLILFWVISFLHWGLYDFLLEKFPASGWLVNNVILFICFIMNTGYTVIFFFYPRKKRNYVR
jgi:hypothetical protein